MKKARGFVVSTSIYIAVMVIFAALLLSFGYKKYSTNTADHSPIFQQTWQTYNNGAVGYSLQYPNDWQAFPTSSDQVVYFKSKNIKEEPSRLGMDVATGARITVNFTTVATSQNLEQSFNSYFKEFAKTIKSERVTFNSQSAISYQHTQNTQYVNGIYFIHNQKPATITLATPANFNTNYADIFDRFLSSFRFVQ